MTKALSGDGLAAWFVAEGLALGELRAHDPSLLAGAQLDGRIEAHVRAARHACGSDVAGQVLDAIRASVPHLIVIE